VHVSCECNHLIVSFSFSFSFHTRAQRGAPQRGIHALARFPPLEMQMTAGNTAGRANQADDIAWPHGDAGAQASYARKMRVKRNDLARMAKHHYVSVAASASGEGHYAAARGTNRRSLRTRQVHAFMHAA